MLLFSLFFQWHHHPYCGVLSKGGLELVFSISKVQRGLMRPDRRETITYKKSVCHTMAFHFGCYLAEVLYSIHSDPQNVLNTAEWGTVGHQGSGGTTRSYLSDLMAWSRVLSAERCQIHWQMFLYSKLQKRDTLVPNHAFVTFLSQWQLSSIWGWEQCPKAVYSLHQRAEGETAGQHWDTF